MLAYAAIALAAFVCVPSFVTASGPTHLTYHTDKQYEYEKYPWHNSIELLWRTQWQPLSEHGIYPFDQYTNGTDFAGIFDRLISEYGDTSANDFDQNTWASFFLGPGRDVLSQAEQAERDGDIDQAKALYMRAATIFRIGYYPWVGLETQSKLKRRAWELEKKAFESGIRYEDLKFESLSIPYPDGTLSKELPFYVMSPKGKKNGDLHKVVLLISGLDHYRTGQIGDVLDLVSDGFGVVVVDMPGTGDAPISGRNTNADAAYWEAIMSWIEQNSQQRSWDLDNVWAWGLSTGSYYSIKISRTQHKRLRGVLAQSAASHYTFKPDWLKSSDHLSYPVALWSTLGYAFGYQDKNEFAKNAEKYSLLRQGVLDKKSAPLTMVNGLDDTVFPIDDGIILSLHGDGAKLRIFQGQGHMGQPASGPFVSSFWKEVASAP